MIGGRKGKWPIGSWAGKSGAVGGNEQMGGCVGDQEELRLKKISEHVPGAPESGASRERGLCR